MNTNKQKNGGASDSCGYEAGSREIFSIQTLDWSTGVGRCSCRLDGNLILCVTGGNGPPCIHKGGKATAHKTPVCRGNLEPSHAQRQSRQELDVAEGNSEGSKE